MKFPSWKEVLFGLTFLFSIYFTLWLPDRSEFNWLITSYSISFLSYLLLIRFGKHPSLILIALFAIGGSFLFDPHLSNDYYRFIWDGELIVHGINPFDHLPDTLIQSELFSGNSYFQNLHAGMGDLSARHYSCYPSINQLYFYLSALISDDIALHLTVMRILILLTVLFGVFFLNRILLLINLDVKRIWLVILNPLFIIESFGNVHFEAVMVSFVLAGIYLLMKSKDLLAGVVFSIAIHVKLIPILILPFVLRIIGLKRSILFYISVLIGSTLLAILFLWEDNYQNFVDSLALYFNSFEFNSFALYPLSELGKIIFEVSDITVYSSALSQITLFVIALLSLYGRRNNWSEFLTRLTWGLFIYFLLTSTLHPWYLTTLLVISVLTKYSFVLIWTLMAFLSYQFYSHLNYHDIWYRSLIGLEYLVVIIFAFYEVSTGKSIFSLLQFKDHRQPISSE